VYVPRVRAFDEIRCGDSRSSLELLYGVYMLEVGFEVGVLCAVFWKGVRLVCTSHDCEF
jgi:hypothetical protein